MQHIPRTSYDRSKYTTTSYDHSNSCWVVEPYCVYQRDSFITRLEKASWTAEWKWLGDHNAASAAMEYESGKLDGDMAREDDLAPEILDIRPFCVQASTPEVQVVVRLLVSCFRPAPSRLLVLHSGDVLHEKELSGEEDRVTIPLRACPPGVINVVVIAEAPDSPVARHSECVTANNIGGKSGLCEQSRVHISSVGPLPVLPPESAAEMMDLFNSGVELAMACSVPISDDNHYLLREGHVFTDAQKSSIEEMLWRYHFRPFADDLDFLLNNVTRRDLNNKSLKNVEESQVSEATTMEKLFYNMVNFFIEREAFYTLSFLFEVCQSKGIGFDMDVSPQNLASTQRNEVKCERKGTSGLYTHYSSSDFLEEEQLEPEVQEKGFQRGDVTFPESLLEGGSMEGFPSVAERKLDDLDADRVSIFNLKAPSTADCDFMSMPGGSPGLMLQGLSQGTASMEALGPGTNELPFNGEVCTMPHHRVGFEDANLGLSFCSHKGKLPGGHEYPSSLMASSFAEYPPPLIVPSFAEALLSTENTSLSMAVATMLVSCWLYLVWGEWGVVIRTIAGVATLAGVIFWMRGVRFKYRSQLVWVSRICLVAMLVGNGAGWFRCPCICNRTSGEECIGGVLQSLFWLFTSASGHQMRIARQVGLLVVEALAFFYSMSKQTPGCNKISIIGLVLIGEVISLMMSLSEFSQGMEGDLSHPKNVNIGLDQPPASHCSSQSIKYAGGAQKSKAE